MAGGSVLGGALETCTRTRGRGHAGGSLNGRPNEPTPYPPPPTQGALRQGCCFPVVLSSGQPFIRQPCNPDQSLHAGSPRKGGVTLSEVTLEWRPFLPRPPAEAVCRQLLQQLRDHVGNVSQCTPGPGPCSRVPLLAMSRFRPLLFIPALTRTPLTPAPCQHLALKSQ